MVAQQIHCIQQAIVANVKTFNFEGTQLALDPTCCIFITMNPGSVLAIMWSEPYCRQSKAVTVSVCEYFPCHSDMHNIYER